jgi:hypothetical protein
MAVKPKAGNQKRETVLNMPYSAAKNSRGSGVDELAVAYRIARGAPARRMPAIRAVLRSYLDACTAIIDGIPATRHRAMIDDYLGRLLEIRACSLAPGDWELDVLDWLWNEGAALQYLKSKNIW